MPAPTPTPSPTPQATESAPLDLEAVAARYREVQWFRTAAEYRALAIQTYRAAGERLRALEAPLVDGSWAVILDADETILDNSLFEKRIAETGETFTEEAWDRWVLEEAAPAIPGAVEFVALVRRLGGRVGGVPHPHPGGRPAPGPHQAANAGLAIAVLDNLPGFRVSDDALATGLRTVDWPARIQPLKGKLRERLPKASELWLDGAHNAHGAMALAVSLEEFFGQVPPESGMAYIVVQHLDPTQKAMLA